MSVTVGTLEQICVKPGDVVRFHKARPGFEEYESRHKFRDFVIDNKGAAVSDCGEYHFYNSVSHTFRLIKRASATGPVRTVTRKEIVPGVYDGVEITHVDTDGHGRAVNVCIGMDNGFGPEGLRAAIATLTEIADALEAPTQ